MPRDLEKYGYTPGCKPCELMTKNRSARGRVHSKHCRERIQDALRTDGDPRVARAVERMNEYCAARGPSTNQEEGGGEDIGAEQRKETGVEQPGPDEARAEISEEMDDVDDLMDDTVSMLMSVGVTSSEIHEEAKTIRKVLLTCGGEKATVRAKIIEVYSPPRGTDEARRRFDLNVEGEMSFDLRADENGER